MATPSMETRTIAPPITPPIAGERPEEEEEEGVAGVVALKGSGLAGLFGGKVERIDSSLSVGHDVGAHEFVGDVS